MESEKLKIRLAPKYFASEFFIAQLHPHKRYRDKQAESHRRRKPYCCNPDGCKYWR